MTFLKNVRVVIGDIGNQNKNVEFPFRIKKELQEDEKNMLRNMSEIRKLHRKSKTAMHQKSWKRKNFN